MSSIQKLPKIFTDRCLGNKKVPERLRQNGLDVITMSEHYGEELSQKLQGDEEWLKMVGDRGWIVFTKDQGIRRNDPEKQIVVKHKVKCFSIANSKNLDGKALADRFLRNLDSIIKASLNDGPMFYNVAEHGITKVDLGFGSPP